MLSQFAFRNNSIGFLRLFFAAVVVFSHAFVLGGFGADPLGRWSGGSQTLGLIAVGGFFVLSGFLITRSYETTDNFGRFLWHRILRIFPAFWVCLLATAFVFAPIALIKAPSEWWPSAGVYITSNALLKTGTVGIGSIFAGLPYPFVFDGSLWTLQWEFICYLFLGLIGALGLLNCRPMFLAAFTTCLYALYAIGTWSVSPRTLPALATLGLLSYFGFGATAYLMRERIPMRGWIAALLGIIAIVSMPTRFHAWFVIPCLAYVTLYAAMVLPIRSFDRRADLSYGLYIYAFPIQQLLVLYGAAGLGFPVFLTLALSLALTIATGSWFLIERPCLSLKGYKVGLLKASLEPPARV